MKLKCFVAMAFGEGDTDSIFDKIIKPTLQKNNLSVIRIDKLNHNGEINFKLVEEMKSCAFGLADLTYARPSVYYEAGYLSVNKKIIYTSRKDHFKDKPEDKYGNFKIHFDLKMKNIIDWTASGSYEEFEKKLTDRIRIHFGPVIRNFEHKELVKQSEELFNKKSHNEKMKVLQKKCSEFLLRNKFKMVVEDFSRGWIIGARKINGERVQIRMRVYGNLLISDLREFAPKWHQGRVQGDADAETAEKVHKVVISLNKIKKIQISRTLTEFYPISDNSYLYRYSFEGDEKIYKTHYLFFDNVKSEKLFDEIKPEIQKIK